MPVATRRPGPPYGVARNPLCARHRRGFHLSPDFEDTCNATVQASGARFLTAGAADLRFHAGNYVGADFPTGTSTTVRIDLYDLADTIRAGHRLAVVVDQGGGYWAGQPYYPQIWVRSDSHLVLPIVDGTFGGQAPTLTYPPRPFAPATS